MQYSEKGQAIEKYLSNERF